MEKMTIIKGISNKSDWLFLCSGDCGEIIKGFRGGMIAVRAYLDKKFPFYVLGGMIGHGDARRREVWIMRTLPPEWYKRREQTHDELMIELGRGAAENARTQLRNWR